MGMTSDQNENNVVEERAQKKTQKKRIEDIPYYRQISVITLNGKMYQLLIGEDKKWYKAEYLRDIRYDEQNKSPRVQFYSPDIVPLTKDEFNSYFYSK